jgi:hypothetical protein
MLERDEAPLAEQAIATLTRFDSPQAEDALWVALGEEDSSTALTAAAALAFHGHRQALLTAAPRLTVLSVRDRAAAILLAAGWRPKTARELIHVLVSQRNGALLRVLWPQAREVLLADLRSPNPMATAYAGCALIELGPEEVVDDLISRIQRGGGKALAQICAGCGRQELDAAATAWAIRSGQSLSGRLPVAERPLWGKMR